LRKIIEPEIAKTGKKAVLLVTDNGSDWNPKSMSVFLNDGRLWRDLHLNVLDHTTYAAGHSAVNMIEHAWHLGQAYSLMLLCQKHSRKGRELQLRMQIVQDMTVP
jgi:hypothetical protein